MSEYPLFPELSEEAAEEAQAMIEKFKKALISAAEDTIGDLYCNILPHIESDSWTNFRNDLLAGFKNYDNRKIQGQYNFKEIRQAILREHREDIIKDLDQDNLEEIERLKKEIETLRRFNLR